MVTNPLAVWETCVQPLGWEDPLEEGMATHFSILPWRIPLDRGAWRATVHEAAKSLTQLSDWTHFSLNHLWNNILPLAWFWLLVEEGREFKSLYISQGQDGAKEIKTQKGDLTFSRTHREGHGWSFSQIKYSVVFHSFKLSDTYFMTDCKFYLENSKCEFSNYLVCVCMLLFQSCLTLLQPYGL